MIQQSERTKVLSELRRKFEDLNRVEMDLKVLMRWRDTHGRHDIRNSPQGTFLMQPTQTTRRNVRHVLGRIHG